MGQYYCACNVTKREVVHPWQVGSGAKLGEICAHPMAGALAYLLRASSKGGGGDIVDPETTEYAGRWAGDHVVLAGEYDESGLYRTACDSYTDVARPLAEEYNRFVGTKSLALRIKDEGGDGSTS